MKKTFSEMKLERHIPTLISSWRQKEGGAFLSDKEYNSVSNSLLQLQRGLTGKRDLIGVNYMNDKNFLGAYLLYYWPVSYLQISYAALSVKDNFFSVVENAKRENRDVRILDLGSGPGPACAAVSDIVLNIDSFADRLASGDGLVVVSKTVMSVCTEDVPGAGAEVVTGDVSRGVADSLPGIDVTLLDQSEKSLGIAKRIFDKDFSGAKVSTSVCDFESSGFEKILSKGFDVVVMSHAINELWKGDKNFIEKRCSFLRKVCGSLNKNGFMLVAEPALLETSRSLLKVRDGMIDLGVNVIAPCFCSRFNGVALKCPAILAGENQTCHGEVSWKPCEPVGGIAKRAGLDRESVKMSYIVLQNNSDDDVVYSEECDAKSGAGCGGAGKNIMEVTGKNKPLSKICGRVVSDGMLNKAGRLRFVFCNGKERITVSAKNGDPVAKEKGFFSLKRFDMVEIEKPEIRGDKNNISYGVNGDTKITISRFVGE